MTGLLIMGSVFSGLAVVALLPSIPRYGMFGEGWTEGERAVFVVMVALAAITFIVYGWTL